MSVITFPGSRRDAPTTARTVSRRRGLNMRHCQFRSYDLILKADEAELVDHVDLEFDKAKTKLRKVREQLETTKRLAADRIKRLAAVETKLGGAIVAAVLSRAKQ